MGDRCSAGRRQTSDERLRFSLQLTPYVIIRSGLKDVYWAWHIWLEPFDLSSDVWLQLRNLTFVLRNKEAKLLLFRAENALHAKCSTKTQNGLLTRISAMTSFRFYPTTLYQKCIQGKARRRCLKRSTLEREKAMLTHLWSWPVRGYRPTLMIPLHLSL